MNSDDTAPDDAYDLSLDDPIEQANALRREIVASFQRTALLVRVVLVGFVVTVTLLIIILGGIFQVTTSTNEAVNNDIRRLERIVAERDIVITQQEDVISQAVDAIVSMQATMRENGIEPPEVILRPTTTTEPED